MTDNAPERIWAEQTGYFKRGEVYLNGGRWSDDEESGQAEYIRADIAADDLHRAVNAERERCAAIADTTHAPFTALIIRNPPTEGETT